MQGAEFSVVVCGSLHLDIVVRTPELPRLDQTAVGHEWRQVCGGKGRNQAVQARTSGVTTAMIGRVGRDDFGRVLLADLAERGVDTSCVASDAAAGSGMSVALLQDNGEYGAVIVSGSNAALQGGEARACWRRLGGGKVLVLQNEIPHACNVAMASIARESGATVVFNAAPARHAGAELLDHVDVLVVNRIEAEAMAGLAVNSRAEARGVISRLSSSRRAAVITLGGEGLVVSDTSGRITEIEPLPVDVVSAHGAGDCFVGTLAAELSRGTALAEACRAANRQAADYVSRRN